MLTQEQINSLQTPEVYNRADVAWFHTSKDPNWALSNMAPFRIRTFDGHLWNSSEALYQATKFAPDAECLPKETNSTIGNVRERIKQANNPRAAKMTQKCASHLVRPDWVNGNVRIKAMLWVLELKALNNPKAFGAALLATDDKPIVEISVKDDFWGAKPQADGTLKGANVLGKLLMIVREKFRQGAYNYNTPDLAYPEGFLL